ncbi:hypothetical protein [Hymenobacter chitinivorans]|uniref:Uncharacterized protein n=1 Tax=Hymenobacter chitinivorans DSM 11115 TaxID=1121954 RepID=A0A2M9BP37_9BACT|nr:hypothetical protein [Hymenobacter chitinivorans]PJJ59719.1 hypothetical protein CLV45_1141 [Hymenobacter chitinivorans DSM 11115]
MPIRHVFALLQFLLLALACLGGAYAFSRHTPSPAPRQAALALTYSLGAAATAE